MREKKTKIYNTTSKVVTSQKNIKLLACPKIILTG